MTEPEDAYFASVDELSKDLVNAILNAVHAGHVKPGALIAVMAMTSQIILKHVADNSVGYSFEKADEAFMGYLEAGRQFYAKDEGN